MAMVHPHAVPEEELHKAEMKIQMTIEEKLEALSFWSKMTAGEIWSLEKHEVQQIFDAMDEKRRGEIEAESLMEILNVDGISLTREDVLCLIKDADRDGTGMINVKDMYRAFTQGEFTFNLVKEELAKREEDATKIVEVPRECLIQWMSEEHAASTNLWSLPSTVALFFAFVYGVAFHLKVGAVFGILSSIEYAWHNAGFSSWYENTWEFMSGDMWAVMSFVNPVLLKLYIQQDLNFTVPYPGRLLQENQMIGGLRIKRYPTTPGDCQASQALVNIYTTTNQCNRVYDEAPVYEWAFYHESIADTLNRFSSSPPDGIFPWVSIADKYVYFGTLVYNANLNVFVFDNHVIWHEESGQPRIDYRREGWNAEPYASPADAVLDIIFVCLIIKMLVAELRELIPASMTGFEGFLNYFDAWKLIDWTLILGAVFLAVWWGMTVSLIQHMVNASIQQLPSKQLDELVFRNRSYLPSSVLEAFMPRDQLGDAFNVVYLEAEDIVWFHGLFRLWCFLYMFILLLKFFKAFQANPRTGLIVETMQWVAVDLAHFIIVTLAVFMVFAFAGQCIFGGNQQGYQTFGAALKTLWISIEDQDYNFPRESHAYRELAIVWNMLYRFCFVMILLQITLGIMVETFPKVKAKYTNGRTLWKQLYDEVETIRETRGFKELFALLVELKDEQFPAHPGKTVTWRSLKKAFDRIKLSRANAEYLVRKTSVWMADKKQTDTQLDLHDALRLASQARLSLMKTEDTVEKITAMMKEDDGTFLPQTAATQDLGNTVVYGARDESSGYVGPSVTALMPKLTVVQQYVQAAQSSQAATVAFIHNEMKQQEKLEVEKSEWLLDQLLSLEKRLERSTKNIGILNSWLDGVKLKSLQELPEILNEIPTNFLEQIHGAAPLLERTAKMQQFGNVTGEKPSEPVVETRAIAKAQQGRLRQLANLLEDEARQPRGTGVELALESPPLSPKPRSQDSASSEDPERLASPSATNVPLGSTSGTFTRPADAHIQRLEQRLQELSDMVTQLSNIPNENSEIRKLLWKINLSLQNAPPNATAKSTLMPPSASSSRRPSGQL